MPTILANGYALLEVAAVGVEHERADHDLIPAVA